LESLKAEDFLEDAGVDFFFFFAIHSLDLG
jgi:hypothetical protein